MSLFHCSADHSTDIGLNAYEKLLKAGPRKNILRIEHFGDFMMTPEQLRRAVAMDIKVSVQPAWLTNLARSNYENLGKERADTSFRFRAMIDAGLEPSGGPPAQLRVGYYHAAGGEHLQELQAQERATVAAWVREFLCR